MQDGDLMIFNMVQEWNREINIFLDPNHIKCKFHRILDKFDQKGNYCFGTIKNILSSFFNRLLYENKLTIGQKKLQWLNVIHHITGEHGVCMHSFSNITNCPDPIEICNSKDSQLFVESDEKDNYQLLDKIFNESEASSSEDLTMINIEELEAPPSEANDPPPIINPSDCPMLIYYLKSFLNYTVNLYNFVSPLYTTQKNESIHFNKTKFTQKNTSYKNLLNVGWH